jgi:competence protein ComEA
LVWPNRSELLLIAGAAIVVALAIAYPWISGDEEPRPLVIQSDAPLPIGAPIRVEVAGAVANPGVYDLSQGDRIADALAAAGGATADADMAAINLARQLRDEEQIVVPRIEATAVPAAPVVVPGELIDINTAGVETLDLLPGIGEAYSRRIVDSRSLDGPYASIDELLQRKVLPQAVFDGIRDLITVGQ